MEFPNIEYFQDARDNECRRHLQPLFADYPRYKELESIYDGGEH